MYVRKFIYQYFTKLIFVLLKQKLLIILLSKNQCYHIELKLASISSKDYGYSSAETSHKLL